MYGDENKSRLITHTAAFIALITVGGWISIPLGPVPFTLQTFFVLLSGVVLKRAAVIPVALYLLIGTLNIPVFHNGLAGIGVVLGPTGGYLAGFLLAAGLTGLAYESEHNAVRIGGLACSVLLITITGVLWLSFSTGMPLYAAFLIGGIPFIPGDLLKAAAVFVLGGRNR